MEFRGIVRGEKRPVGSFHRPLREYECLVVYALINYFVGRARWAEREHHSNHKFKVVRSSTSRTSCRSARGLGQRMTTKLKKEIQESWGNCAWMNKQLCRAPIVEFLEVDAMSWRSIAGHDDLMNCVLTTNWKVSFETNERKAAIEWMIEWHKHA